MTVSIIGASGATGKELLALLIENKAIDAILVFVRKSLVLNDAKITEYIVDFDNPTTWTHLVKGDVAFSCLGTTLKAAGSKEKQWKVDYEYQFNFAKSAVANNVSTLVLISASNASSTSNFYYSRMKGELEEAVKSLGFDRIIIFQPALLLRKNSDRKGEVLAEKILKCLNILGLFISSKPLPTIDLAKAMLQSTFILSKGIHVIKASEIRNLLK